MNDSHAPRLSTINRLWLSLFLSPIIVMPVAILALALDQQDEINWLLPFGLAAILMYVLAPRLLRRIQHPTDV